MEVVLGALRVLGAEGEADRLGAGKLLDAEVAVADCHPRALASAVPLGVTAAALKSGQLSRFFLPLPLDSCGSSGLPATEVAADHLDMAAEVDEPQHAAVVERKRNGLTPLPKRAPLGGEPEKLLFCVHPSHRVLA